MTNTTKTTRLRTHSGRWADLWNRMEDLGLPFDQRDVKAWSKKYNSVQADLLLKALDRLHELHLPNEAVSLLADAVIAAFKMGREAE